MQYIYDHLNLLKERPEVMEWYTGYNEKQTEGKAKVDGGGADKIPGFSNSFIQYSYKTTENQPSLEKSPANHYYKTMSVKKLVSISEYAESWGIARSTVYQLIADGVLTRYENPKGEPLLDIGEHPAGVQKHGDRKRQIT